MKEKIISTSLIVIAVFFLPIFITTLLTDIRKDTKDSDDLMINIQYQEGEMKIPLETYLIGVVAAEMPVYFEEEALKAQVVTARTYTLKRYMENPNIIFTEDIQNYYSNKELEDKWGVEDYAFYYSRIKGAVLDTKDQVITFNNELIDAVFHSTSVGMTRSAKDVWGQDIPYLQSAESLEDINAPTYLHNYAFDFKAFQDEALKYDPQIVITKELASEVQVVERNNEGYILSIQIGNKIFTGEEFRKIYDLASSNFSLSFSKTQVNIVCKGYGHGVGLSQFGAEAMASGGKKYDEIIKHYFRNVAIVDKASIGKK